MAFVLLTFGFTWGVEIPVALLTSSRELQFAAVVVGAFGPAVAAATLVWLGEGDLGVWLRDVLSWRVTPRWYLAALAVPLAGVAGQTLVYGLFFGPLDASVLPRRAVMWLGLVPVALLLTGGNEEFGWRGFLLPRLQRTHDALTASLLVGVVWLVWHLPGDLLLTALGSGLAWSPGRIALRLAVLPLAVVLTWLYNGSDGSVVVAVVFHAGWNTMGVLVPAPFPTGGTGIAASAGSVLQVVRVGIMVAVALALVGRYGTSTLSPGERHTGPNRTG